MAETIRTEIMNVDDVCAYLKASRSTVYKMSQNGDIPCSKVGRIWKFDREQIDEWLRSQDGAKALAAASAEEGGAAGRESARAGGNASVDSGDSLDGLGLTDKQIATLRAFSMTSPIQLALSMSTEAGRVGLQAALGISPGELDAIAQKLTAKMRK